MNQKRAIKGRTVLSFGAMRTQARCVRPVWWSSLLVVVLGSHTAIASNEPASPKIFDPARWGSVSRYVEFAPDVRDPVLAFLVGLLKDDVIDTLTGAEIKRNSFRPGVRSLIPIELLEFMGRGQGSGGVERVVTLWLTREGKVPAPYSLLGYHPGSVLIPRRVVLYEWRCGHVVISDRVRGSFTLEDCYLWAIEEGEVAIDIDKVVDRALGGAVDDMVVRSLALFRFKGTPYAMGMGYNLKGQGRSGALNLAKNELEFPSPWQFKAAGRVLRGKAESLVRASRDRGMVPASPRGEEKPPGVR